MHQSEIILSNLPLFYFMVTLFSLMVGSLLNVVIYRLPLMLKAEQLSECTELLNLPKEKLHSLNLFFPRSFCPHCKHQIKALDNIPLLSYLILKGRCRYCLSLINWRYPLVEALSALLALYASWHFGFNLHLFFSLIFIWISLCLIFIDLDHQLLPDSLTLLLLWLGLIANTQSLFTPLSNAVLSAAGAYLFLWLFIKLFYLITGKIGMGHGDFKLFAALGAWFGWTILPLILLVSSITGAIVGIIFLKYKKQSKDTPIAFGPFLSIAGMVALFWGPAILNGYIKMFF